MLNKTLNLEMYSQCQTVQGKRWNSRCFVIPVVTITKAAHLSVSTWVIKPKLIAFSFKCSYFLIVVFDPIKALPFTSQLLKIWRQQRKTFRIESQHFRDMNRIALWENIWETLESIFSMNERKVSSTRRSLRTSPATVLHMLSLTESFIKSINLSNIWERSTDSIDEYSNILIIRWLIRHIIRWHSADI